MNGNAFGGAHSTSFRMSVMRKCEERQLTFKSGALLIGNGRGAAALYNLAQCKYLTRSRRKKMNVKKVMGFHVMMGKTVSAFHLLTSCLKKNRIFEHHFYRSCSFDHNNYSYSIDILIHFL